MKLPSFAKNRLFKRFLVIFSMISVAGLDKTLKSVIMATYDKGKVFEICLKTRRNCVKERACDCEAISIIVVF